MSEKPELSVIIASYNAGNTIEGCLRSLEDQTAKEDIETIVIDSSSDGTGKLIATKFPKVKLHRFPERKFPGDARNVGVSLSRGNIIAFIDTDCIADRDWCGEIIKAHKAYTAYPVIGGVVDNGNPDSHVGWASYFCEFSQWMPQLQEQEMVEIPTCCLSLKRRAFETYGPFLEKTYSSDTAFHWNLQKNGLKPLFVPSIKVLHINSSSLKRLLRKRFIRGKHFASVRTYCKEFSPARRVLCVAAAPLLPFLLFARRTITVFQNRIYHKQFMMSSLLVFLGFCIWSTGELVGYLEPDDHKHEKEPAAPL